MNSIGRFPSTPAPAEVDLLALIESLWKQKYFIILFAVAVMCLASLYAFLAAPEYRVTSVLRPVSIKELDSLNRSGIYPLSPDAALLKVAAALESYDTRLAFYRANTNLFKGLERPGNSFDQNFEAFNRKSIRVTVNNGAALDGMPPSVVLELDYPKNVEGFQLLNGFVDFALAHEQQRLAADFQVVLKNRIAEIDKSLDAARAAYDISKRARIAQLQEADNIRRAQLQDELNALRQQLKMARKDRIAQLAEAIGIARSLGIVKPTAPSALGDSAYQNPTNVIRTEVNYQQLPLYFMGTEALEAERSALLHRKSDEFTEARIAQIFRELQMLQSNREVEMLNKRSNEDLFLSNVDAQRNEYLRLSALNIDSNALQLVDIDRRAVQPSSPLKPNKPMVIILGAVFGLILGVLIALVRQFFRLKKAASLGSVTLEGAPAALPVACAKTLVHD
ncbi:Wzz/FepE/Etk N-terminal domain-containing protein [Pseudomonas donghuensis]|uniref:Wzz/FepE/Etk N-terminal domain-containing protein n=1 Tax=Pseudomonas donghuensis TaxID=1163398 RepID=UPI002160FB22|nr:Wzz/FepE/Etk N-terminal domain-containing protein [Pseudomonas donghuensis]UVL28187.1 Wzz/FepE/Etk N-terminal domain-containing protein [Pseudomonas donghuensis]